MALESPRTNGNGSPIQINWAAIRGKWDMADTVQIFRGDGPSVVSADGRQSPLGLAVSSASLQSGTCQVQVRFSSSFAGNNDQAGGLVLGYRSTDRPFLFARLGGKPYAYFVGEYANGEWRMLAATGSTENLKHDREYSLQIKLVGQELSMVVDGVPVLQHVVPNPIEGRQTGLIAAGTSDVSFSNFKFTYDRPRAFVVMQFAEPYNTFYRQVIQSQAEAAGFEVFRIDEKDGPGVIFQDIQREIEQASVVIAEITPANPNVFYEVGYAHALRKPTILLAQRGAELPFDIRSFRVVFYNDSIAGKAEVERNLQNHLEAVAGR